MANTKQAKKRAAQSDRRNARNRSVRTQTRGAVKALRAAVSTDPEKAQKALPVTSSALDVAVRKGVLHKTTASRLKSRAAKAVAKAR